MDNDIAAGRISCTPQKLQAILAMVKTGCSSQWTVGQAGRKKCRARAGARRQRWLAAVQPGCSGKVVMTKRGSGGVAGTDQAVPAGAWDEVVQATGSDGTLSAGCCCRWAASIRNDFGAQPNSSLNSLLK